MNIFTHLAQKHIHVYINTGDSKNLNVGDIVSQGAKMNFLKAGKQ